MEHQSIRVIYRHEMPTKLDSADYKTLCRVGCDIEPKEYYIQLSQNPEIPKWEYLGAMNNEEILLKLIDYLQ